jgi:archaeosine synthase beta-subunit
VTAGSGGGPELLALRAPRRPVDPFRPNAAFVEIERSAAGRAVPVATLLLADRECAFRCVHCDLYRDTLPGAVPPGALVEQVRRALAELPHAEEIKLYNAGSFFDENAVPPEDRRAMLGLVSGFERVIVESHPAYLKSQAFAETAAALGRRLEVAIGLETIHPEILPLLDKKMTLADFDSAAARLREAGAALRAFVLVGLPWLDPAEAAAWAIRSARYVAGRGATAISLVPTRGGNGVLDELAGRGLFREPSLADVEAAAGGALAAVRGAGARLFVDTWDLARFADCSECLEPRKVRLERLSLEQDEPPAIRCGSCGSH